MAYYRKRKQQNIPQSTLPVRKKSRKEDRLFSNHSQKFIDIKSSFFTAIQSSQLYFYMDQMIDVNLKFNLRKLLIQYLYNFWKFRYFPPSDFSIFYNGHQFFFVFLKNLFVYFWLRWVFVAARGVSLSAVRVLLIVVASLVAEHGLQAHGLQQLRAQQLWLTGSRAQAQQLWRTGLVAPRHVGSSWARDQTRIPLHWQADS